MGGGVGLLIVQLLQSLSAQSMYPSWSLSIPSLQISRSGSNLQQTCLVKEFANGKLGLLQSAMWVLSILVLSDVFILHVAESHTLNKHISLFDMLQSFFKKH